MRHARRLLQERAIAGKLGTERRMPQLRKMFDEQTDVTRKLRGRCGRCTSSDRLDEKTLLGLLDSKRGGGPPLGGASAAGGSAKSRRMRAKRLAEMAQK